MTTSHHAIPPSRQEFQGEQSCRSILDNCPSGIVVTDAQGVITYVNRMLCDMTGYAPEELLGATPRLMKSGLTPPEVHADLWRTITTGKRWEGELQNRKKCGDLYWEALSISPATSADGTSSYFIGVKRDISRRKKLEAELHTMAAVVRNSNDFIGLCTPDLKPFFLNEAGYRMIGIQPESPLPDTILTCFWPDDLALIQSVAIPTLIREGRWSGEVRFRNFSTGSPVHTIWNAFVIYDTDGRPIAWATNSPDLTPLKETEQALRLAHDSLARKVIEQNGQLRFSEEKLLTAFLLSPDAMIITRMSDGIYLEVNDGFTVITGYEKHEAVGRTSLDLNIWVEPADRIWLMKAIEESDQILDFEAQFRRKDGTILTGLLNARRISVGNEACIMTFTRDITDRKKAEETLRQSTLELKEAQRVANVGSWQLNPETGVGVWSEEMYRIFGFTPCAPVPAWADRNMLFTGSSLEHLDAAISKAVRDGEPYTLDLELSRPDGAKRWITARGEAISSQSGVATKLRGTVIDITDRKRIEDALLRRNRLYATLYAANQAIIRAEDRESLFQDICSVIVEQGGFNLVWVGLEDRESREVRPVAVSGPAAGYLDSFMINTTCGSTGSGPTGVAIRKGISVVCNDFLNDPSTRYWHEKAQHYGIRSSATFPLLVFGTAVGAMMVYADAANCFTHDDTELFAHLAEDISVALENMEREQQRRSSEQQLAIVQERQAEMATELSLLDEQLRLRISSELHDSIGQSLALSQIKLGSLAAANLPAAEHATIQEALSLIEQSITQVRSLTLQLTPPILASAGLEAALAWLCRQITKDYNLKISFEDDNTHKPLSEILRSILYQAARELLINVAKHARCSAACLSVQRTGIQMQLTVRDNGIGFDPSMAFSCHKEGCFGLFNIVRQIRHLGGIVTVDSSSGSGSAVTLQVPLLMDEESESKGVTV